MYKRLFLSITIFILFLSFSFQSTTVFAATDEIDAYEEFLKEKIFTMSKSEWTKGIMDLPPEEHDKLDMFSVAFSYFPAIRWFNVATSIDSYKNFTKDINCLKVSGNEISECEREEQLNKSKAIAIYNETYDLANEGQYEVAEKKVRELDNQVGSMLFSYKYDSAYKAVEKVNPYYEGYFSKDELYSKLEEVENNHKGTLAYKEVESAEKNINNQSNFFTNHYNLSQKYIENLSDEVIYNYKGNEFTKSDLLTRLEKDKWEHQIYRIKLDLVNTKKSVGNDVKFVTYYKFTLDKIKKLENEKLTPEYESKKQSLLNELYQYAQDHTVLEVQKYLDKVASAKNGYSSVYYLKFAEKEVLLLDENYYPKEKQEFLSQIAAYSKVYEDFYW